MATATKEKESDYNVVYEEKIITSEIQYESPIDISKVPTFTLNGCEVLIASTSGQPKFGHSIMLLLPQDADFVSTDRKLRNYFAQSRQSQDPNCESYKAQPYTISQKHMLEDQARKNRIYKDEYLNRQAIAIQISNPCMFDTDAEEGDNKSIKKYSEAKNGNVTVKYFRVRDAYTGEGIEPQVFKMENGEKSTTYVNKKTGEEKPRYVGKNDLVNIVIRPYEQQNKKTGEWSLRYNILSIEIVQTAFDRGMSTYKNGGSKKVEEAPDAISLDGLSSMFGGESTVEAKNPKTNTKKEVKAEEKLPTSKAELPHVESTTCVPGKEPEVTQVQVELPKTESAPAAMFDFSQLGSDLSNMNLGE